MFALIMSSLRNTMNWFVLVLLVFDQVDLVLLSCAIASYSVEVRVYLSRIFSL